VERQRSSGEAGPSGRGDTVIVYHAIGSVARGAGAWNGFIRPDRFAAHMDYLAQRRTVVALDELLSPAAQPGPPRVAIAFDDGYRSALEQAVPILRAHGFPATFFIPTKWIGCANVWDPDAGVARDLMSADQLVALARDGFAVESHGHGHLDYARADPDAAAEDVRVSVERLTDLLGRPPRYLAYPYGRASRAAAAEAERLGLRAAFALERPQPLTGPYALPRTPIFPADSVPVFALKTTGFYAGWRQSAPVRAGYRVVRPLVRNRWLWP
jgi:peptidoglycan/xylan/chitin deacetylase (PgdA/CDA1 family)